MVDELIAENPAKCPDNEGVLVVIDAGISTEDNLKTIRDKGYNYLCVSRKALTEYTTPENAPKVTGLRLLEARDNASTRNNGQE